MIVRPFISFSPANSVVTHIKTHRRRDLRHWRADFLATPAA
jgi:hypothetical protein